MLIWIASQLFVIYLHSLWAIANETTIIYGNNSMKSHEKIMTAKSVYSNLHIPSSANISYTDMSEQAEILGTAAAYKLDMRDTSIGCSLSEFSCSNGKCIPISKYCDRLNDCDDSSDEPRFCTRKYSLINMLHCYYAICLI